MTYNFPLGWIEDKFDGRDKYYVPLRRVATSKQSPLNLREHKDYGKYFRQPYDQGVKDSKYIWGTCVANAAAALFSYQWNRQGHGSFDPSRLYLYWNARSFGDGDPSDTSDKKQGTRNRFAMKTLARFGVCREDQFPYDEAHFGLKPADGQYNEGGHQLCLEYARLDPDEPEEMAYWLEKEERETIGNLTLLRLRQCLAEGYPVMFSFRIYTKDVGKSFRKDKDGKWEMIPLPWLNERPDHGGHAVLAIGFDDAKGRILCQNSWGTDASITGAPFFYMGYDWIKDYTATTDFWMARIVAHDQNKGKDPVFVANEIDPKDPTDDVPTYEPGSFNTGEVDPGARKQEVSKTQRYYLDRTSLDKHKAPGLVYGFSYLDMACEQEMSLRCRVENRTQSSFDSLIEATRDGHRLGASMSWLEMDHFPGMQWGSLRMESPDRVNRTTGVGNTTWVYFPTQFYENPKVVCFLTAVDLDKTTDYRAKVEPAGVWPGALRLDISSWGDTLSGDISVMWIAHPADMPGVQSGTFSTAEGQKNVVDESIKQVEYTKTIVFEKAFKKPPQVFMAINKLDFGKGHNLRVSTSIKDLTPTYMTWCVGTWMDTVLKEVSVSFVAWEDGLY